MLAVLISGSAFAEQQVPVYPGSVHTRIGKDLTIGGEYFRLAYFLTDDPVEQVALYFVKHWKEQGYPTVMDGDGTDVVVSAFFTREGLMRSVVLRRHAGRTLGFSALKDMWLKTPGSPRDGILTLEGTLHSSDVTFEDGPGGGQHRGHLVERPFQKVYDEVRARLERSGFTLSRQVGQKVEGGRQQMVLEHSGGGQQVVSVVTEMEGNLTALSQMSIGSTRPDLMPNDEAMRKNRAAKGAQK